MRATPEQAELHLSREVCEDMEAANGPNYTNQVHFPAKHYHLALQSAPDPQNRSSCFAIPRQSRQNDRIRLRDPCTQTSSRLARRDANVTDTPRHHRGSIHPNRGPDSHPRRPSLAHSCAQPRPRKPQSTTTSAGRKHRRGRCRLTPGNVRPAPSTSTTYQRYSEAAGDDGDQRESPRRRQHCVLVVRSRLNLPPCKRTKHGRHESVPSCPRRKPLSAKTALTVQP